MTASEEEDDSDFDQLTDLILVVADELVSLVPVAGPAKDLVKAGQEQRLGDYCYHMLMLLCDLTPLALASEAARMTRATSKIARLVRKGKKGYSLRKVAAATKKLIDESERAAKLTPQIRTMLKFMHKVCVRLQKAKVDDAEVDEADRQKAKVDEAEADEADR